MIIKCNRIIKLCKDGLSTDGSHHKQWYLEQILKMAVGKELFEQYQIDNIKDDSVWEKGIAP